MILLAATSFALYLGQQEILAARKKSAKSGFPTGIPYAVRQQLVSCYGFKTKNRGLEIPILKGTRLGIPLTKHTLDAISQPGVKVALSSSPRKD